MKMKKILVMMIVSCLMMICSVSFAAADDHKALGKQLAVAEKMMDAFDENSNGVLDENEKENLPQLKFIAYAVQYAGFEDKPADAWAVIPDEEKD